MTMLTDDAIERVLRQLATQRSPDLGLDVAAMVVAAVEEPGVDPTWSLAELDRIGTLAAERMGAGNDSLSRAAALNQLLAEDLGFIGNAEAYHDPANSCLHRVLETRTGIPITLSVVWIEVARRAGLELLGVGMPTHFIVRLADHADVYLDPFTHGRQLDRAACAQLVLEHTKGRVQLSDSHLEPTDLRTIVRRMLSNLRAIQFAAENTVGALRVTHFMTVLDPDLPELYRDRGALHLGLGDGEAATADLERYLEARPNAGDADVIRHLLAQARSTRLKVH
jgi:regulator of sirC expression with transglutaminase-like and TPR domain